MGIEIQQMIIHVGDVEELNTFLEDVEETFDSSASNCRRKPIGARTVGGRQLKLKRGITMDSGASANVMPRRMAMRQPGYDRHQDQSPE